MIFGFALQVFEGLSRLAENILFPIDELLPEVLKLPLIHEFFVLGRTVIRPISQNFGCLHGHSEPPKYPETRAGLIAKRTVVSMRLAIGPQLRRATRIFEFGHFNSGAQFNVVQNSLERGVIGIVSLIADSAPKSVKFRP